MWETNRRGLERQGEIKGEEAKKQKDVGISEKNIIWLRNKGKDEGTEESGFKK